MGDDGGRAYANETLEWSLPWDGDASVVRSERLARHLLRALDRAEAAERAVAAIRGVLCSHGYCGDGNLPAMVGRALDEALHKLPANAEECVEACGEVDRLIPDEHRGTLAERVRVWVSGLERERDEARDTLSALSSMLGHGLGDDSTTVADYGARIREGVDRVVEVESKRRGSALARLALAEAVLDETPYSDRWHEARRAWLAGREE